MKPFALVKMIVLLVTLLVLCISAEGEAQIVESTFSLKENQRIVAVGDLHGDLQAFRKILRSMSLINLKDEWKGGRSYLVLAGDLIDRGPESKELMDFVMDLEKQALRAKGRVIALLGNHEYLVTQGYFRHIHPNDLLHFKHEGDSEDINSLYEAYLGHSKYATWLRTRPVMVKIGETLFVHAGLGDWVYDYTIEEINENLRLWLMRYQGFNVTPDPSSQFLMEGKGPLWTRWMTSMVDTSIPINEVEAYLRHYGVERLVVGHTIIPMLSQTLRNPLYGERVIMLDSAISIAYQGELTAVEIAQSGIYHFRFDRSTGGRQLVASQTEAGHRLYRDFCVQVIRGKTKGP